MATDNAEETAIQSLHFYKEHLLAEIEAKQADLRSVERTIELLSGDVSHTDQPPARPTLFVTTDAPRSRYAGLKTQAATKLFLQENANRWSKASHVAKELRRRGVRSGKHFGPAITGALNRLADKGVARKEKRSGVYKYKLVTKKDE